MKNAHGGRWDERKRGNFSLYPFYRPFRRDVLVGFCDRSVTAYKYNDKRRLGRARARSFDLTFRWGHFNVQNSTRYS